MSTLNQAGRFLPGLGKISTPAFSLVVYRTQIFRFGAETEQPNIFKKCSAEYRTEPNIFGNKHDLLLLTCCGAVIKRRQFENAALLCWAKQLFDYEIFYSSQHFFLKIFLSIFVRKKLKLSIEVLFCIICCICLLLICWNYF